MPNHTCGRTHWAFCILHFAFCIGLGTPWRAEATFLLPADFTTVVSEARTIVHGRVVDVRSVMPAGRRTIESLITVAVMETLKGAPTRSLTFRIPTGQVGRYRRVMVGVPEFEPGDEVIVFLHQRPPMLPTLFGLSQGVYRVVRGADGRAVVTPPPVMARGVNAERVVRGDPARRPIPVDDFAREVRTVLERVR
jgi:hypothetical protein